MTAVFIPVSRVAVSYTVKRGRRWTVLEHLLLLELREAQAKASDLAYRSRMPTRIVVEGLINLLRAGWIEVRATDESVLFTATLAGRAVAAYEELPADLSVHPRRTSLCFDRLVGTFLKSDDLDLLHENKLPIDAVKLEPRTFTVPQQDGELVDRLYYDQDEMFDDWRGYLGVSNRFFARVDVALDEITGLPGYAAEGLRQEVFKQAAPHISSRLQAERSRGSPSLVSDAGIFFGEVLKDDIIVGGDEHFQLVQWILRNAKSAVVIHSCFLACTRFG